MTTKTAEQRALEMLLQMMHAFNSDRIDPKKITGDFGPAVAGWALSIVKDKMADEQRLAAYKDAMENVRFMDGLRKAMIEATNQEVALLEARLAIIPKNCWTLVYIPENEDVPVRSRPYSPTKKGTENEQND